MSTTAHPLRVLMLGWELPPRISGGLGTACQGIAEGLGVVGAQVVLVVPRLFGEEDGRGARLLAAGDVPVLDDADSPARRAADLPGKLQLAFLDSPLRPYLTAREYGTRRARRAPDPHPDASPAPFEGGYGEHLADEVGRYARAVAELAARETHDVIHAHDWMTFPAGLLARRVSGRPLVCHVHSCEFDRQGDQADPGVVAIERTGLDGADRVVCVSHFTRSVLESRYRPDPARVRVVHNAVTPPAAGPRRRVPVNGASRVLFLGRLTRQKGPEFFLRSAAVVAKANPNVHFVLAGDGELREELVARASALGLGERVTFPGFLGPAEVERAFAEADLFVMPSEAEPFGIAPLEALALDVPVIVSSASGVREALPSSPVVEHGDVDGLAGKVLTLLARPDLRAELVRSGKRDMAKLGWDHSARRLLDVYREVV